MRRPISGIMGSVDTFSSKAISHVPLNRKEKRLTFLYPIDINTITRYSLSCNLGFLGLPLPNI